MSAIEIGIKALLGGSPQPAGGRITPDRQPQINQLPAITVLRAGGTAEYMIEGFAGWQEDRVSYICLAISANQADELGNEVNRILLPKTRTIMALAGAVTVEAHFFKEGTDVSDSDDNYSIFRRTIDYRVRWRTVAP